jgi:cytoskeleton protein RodZ
MDDKESLGNYLRREREIRKISLREVANHTRVREHLLKAIEEDQFQLLPSATYVKGFLLTYANYIGLEPNDVIRRYENFLKGGPVRHTEVLPEKKILGKRKHLLTIGGVIAASLIALYFFLYLSKPPVESISVKPKTEEILPFPPSPQITGTTSVAEEEPLSLQIKVVEKTWVRIQVDSQPEQEMILKPGEGGSHRGLKQIRLLVGNAGGLDLVFNERPLERFGKSGEVVTLTFTLQGVEVNRHERPKTQ